MGVWRSVGVAGLMVGCAGPELGGAQNRAYEPGSPAVTARVEVAALVSSAHTAYANQDTYVARVFLPHDKAVNKGEGRLALLVDRYPGAGEQIRRSALLDHRPLEMRLRREEGCDRRAREVSLKAKGAEVYDDEVRGLLEERMEDPEAIACFAVEHTATRLAR